MELLKGTPVKFAETDKRGEPAYWFTNTIVEDVEKISAFLQEKGVQTRRFFYPLHMQPCYEGMFLGKFENAEWAYKHGLSLPSSVILKDEEIETVAKAIKEFYF